MIIRDHFCQFYIKSYVVTPHLESLVKMVLTGVTTYAVNKK